MDLFAALEASQLGRVMRASALLYPLANVLHILALMAFAAAVATMDLRLLGLFRQVPLAGVLRALRPAALLAFALQVGSGVMLLAADAGAIAANPAFRLKMLLLGLALVNVAVLEIALRRAPPEDVDTRGSAVQVDRRLPPAQVAAAISLALWLAVAALGRLIAYY